jgi:hypothetical protein
MEDSGAHPHGHVSLTHTRRRRAGLLLVAAVLLVALGHFLWFSLFGPPARWGNDVRAFGAVSDSRAAPPALLAATTALPTDVVAQLSLPDDAGAVYASDVVPESGRALALTHRGSRWIDDRGLYVRDATTGWRELPLEDRMLLQEAKLIVAARDTVILAVRWNSWYPPRYGRFISSIARPELRAEYGIYRMSLDGSGPRYLFPGHSLVVSPDRRRVAYLTSRNGFTGMHNVWVYDATTNRRTRVVSLVEADPGSGISFDCHWAADGQALVIRGSAQRVGVDGARGSSRVDLVYVAADGRLFDAAPGR